MGVRGAAAAKGSLWPGALNGYRKKIEPRSKVLVGCEAQSFHGLIPQGVSTEGVLELEDTRQRRLDLDEVSSGKTLFLKRGRIHLGSPVKRGRTDDVLDNVSCLLLGIPSGGAELTEEYNPLEAGLREAVSFDKGCYVGQEVIARLKTYDKISRSIVGVELPGSAAPAAPGTRLFQNGRDIGALTSCVVPPGFTEAIGLAYVKHRFVEPDLEMNLESPDGPLRARLRRLPSESADQTGRES